MLIGVWPVATVCDVVSIGLKLPAFFNCANQSMPGPTLLVEPPFESDAARTPAIAEFDFSGLPLSATLPL